MPFPRSPSSSSQGFQSSLQVSLFPWAVPPQRPRPRSSLSHSLSNSSFLIHPDFDILSFENHTKVSFSVSSESQRAGKGCSQMGISFRGGNSWCLQVQTSILSCGHRAPGLATVLGSATPTPKSAPRLLRAWQRLLWT